ncbi:MAG: hypothetical protein WCD47_19535 [Candidatus Sulfotelmatobacter sp.]
MNAAPYFHPQTMRLARDRYARLRAVALALIIMGAIGITTSPLSAQDQTDSDNQAGLHSVLNAAAAGDAVSATVGLPLQIGFFAGQTALYITPEVGIDPKAPSSLIAIAHQLAETFNANFIPQNFATLPGSPAVDDIYSFPIFNSQGTAVEGFRQGNVIASRPAPAGPANKSTNYSPLWQVSVVAFNSGVHPYRLTSEADILKAAAKHDVTIAKTPIIVECSVIFTPSGGLLPGATVTLSGSATR